MQLVIGAGEVGTAICEVLSQAHEVGLRDKPLGEGSNVSLGPVEAIHICFPYSDEFMEQVLKYQDQYDPELVIVHSTVPVGTCDPKGWVHSPVRGRHPDLFAGIMAFQKHFGGDQALEAAEIFRLCGVVASIHPNATETEAGKLWEMVQYGHQILMEKQIHAWCQEQGVDFDVVYRQFAQSYNVGYQVLGADWAVRPVLHHLPGPIGGHCVVPASKLLDHPLAKDVAVQSFVLGEDELELEK